MPYKYGWTLLRRADAAMAAVATLRQGLSDWVDRAGQGKARGEPRAKAVAGYSAGPNTASILVFSVAALKGFTM
jgi:hypothetical protein